MSYSVSTRQANKADALADINTKLDEVVAQQPIHSVDMGHAKGAVEVFAALIVEDPDKDFLITVSGSVSQDPQGDLYNASCNVNVATMTRAAV